MYPCSAGLMNFNKCAYLVAKLKNKHTAEHTQDPEFLDCPFQLLPLTLPATCCSEIFHNGHLGTKA